MQSFFVRFFIAVCVVIVQLSFIQVFFSSVSPSIVLMATVAWVLLIGFVRAWPWAIALGLMADLLSFRPVGITAGMLLVAAYITSFFSKRLTVGHRGFGFGVALVFVATLSLLFRSTILFSEYIQTDGQGFAYGQAWMDLMRDGWGIALADILLFFAVYGFLARIERRLGFYEAPLAIKR